MLKWTHKS